MFSIFNKNIFPGTEINNQLVSPYKLRGGKIKVNSTVDVPTGFNFVIVIDGRVTDVVGQGRHKVNGSNMPGTFDMLKLGRASKRGNMKKKFKATVYFVNLKTFVNFKYDSTSAFYLRSQEFGRVKGYAEGTCSVSIVDAEEVIKNLLKRVNVIKPKFAESEVGVTVGNIVNKLIDKSKIPFTDMLLKPKTVEDYINPQTSEMLREVGFEIDEVKLVSFRLTKKVQAKVNEFLSSSTSVNFDGNNVMLQNAEEVLVGIQNNNELAKELGGFNNQSINPSSAKHTFVDNNINKQDDTKAYGYSDDSAVTELLNKRMSDASIINTHLNIADNNYDNPVLDSNKMLSDNSADLKVCKFCGQTIKLSHKYCPKCGFKQQ